MDEHELAKYPGLYQRGGVCYVRKKVPIDLRHLNSGDQVRKSLDTTDSRDAKRLYAAKFHEITRGFEGQRADIGRQDKVTQALLTARPERLSRAEIDGLVWSWWEKRAGARKPDIEDFEVPDTLQAIDDDLRDIAAPRPD